MHLFKQKEQYERGEFSSEVNGYQATNKEVEDEPPVAKKRACKISMHYLHREEE